MELHLKFQQYVRKNWVRRHPETSGKKLLEDNDFIIFKLRNIFFSRRTGSTFGKTSLLSHLPNTSRCDGRGTKVVTHAVQPGSLNQPTVAMAFATRTSFLNNTFALLRRGIIVQASGALDMSHRYLSRKE
jgi:hypothetical protein